MFIFLDSTTVSDLRPVPQEDLWKLKNADEKSVICTNCRKELREYTPVDSQTELHSQETQSSSTSSYSATAHINETINDILVPLGISPIKRKLCAENWYTSTKLDQIQEGVRKKFKTEFNINPTTKTDEIIHDYSVIISNLKKSINEEPDKSQKVKLLKLLPSRWSINKISQEFNVSKRLVNISKLEQNEEYRIESGKPGNKNIDDSIKERVIEFYESEENSKQLPGRKDYKSVMQDDGTRKHLQKKLILSNLSELYALYKNQYPDDKIGFSKFSTLRPKHCVLAGSSGTHTVCTCIIHENVKLMLEGCEFKKLFKNCEWLNQERPSYKHLLDKMICTNPTNFCYERTCEICKNNTDEIREKLEKTFEENGIEDVQYKIWASTDRCTLLSAENDSSEFLDILFVNLEKLVTHDFTI